MTAVLYTVDTELSPALHQRGATPMENLKITVLGEVADGAWGIGYQVERLNAHRLKGVFFVEALCAYAFGNDILKRMVDPILSGGHEVQLHLHPEWLEWIDRDLVGDSRGENLADFTFAEQHRLLELSVESLVAAGAPTPIAFRAGNYGANNDTLRALAAIGLRYDSSYSYPYLSAPCEIEIDRPLHQPAEVDGVVEVPVTFFEDYPGHARHLQLTATSSGELKWAIEQSGRAGRPTAVVVSHSFELLNQKRTRANPILVRRFDDFCALMRSAPAGTKSCGFADLGGDIVQGAGAREAPALKSNPVRTVSRVLQQAYGTVVYDRA